MNLTELLDQEAPNREVDEHDRNYASALKGSWNYMKDMDFQQLQYLRQLASEEFKFYGNTHRAMAGLIVTYYLLENLKNETKT